MLLGDVPGFLFDVLDDGVDDGVCSSGGPVDLPAFAIALARRRNLEIIGQEPVDGFDGGMDDFGAEDFRFDDRFEDGLEAGVEFVDAKDGSQKQSDTDN